MKTIKLALRPKAFEKVLTGEKTQEVREIRPNNESKYIQLDGVYAVTNEAGNSLPVEYDAIEFVCGDKSVLVSVKEAYTEIMVDEHGVPLSYEYEGEPYYMERIVYELGEIIQ